MNIDRKNFCMAPFREVVVETNGTMLPCCEYKYPAPKHQSLNHFNNFDTWHKVELGQLRQRMLDNQPDPGCDYCKSKEQIPGQAHLRSYINGKYPDETPWTASEITTNIDFLEVRFGNYCNLGCIMCGAYASSSIASEYIKNEDKFINSGFKIHEGQRHSLKTVRWWEEPGALDKLYDIAKEVKYIHFTGGEPMMIPEVVDILNAMDPERVIKVSMNSNMTKFTDRAYRAFERFKLVHINASMEGVEEHNDYVRYGSAWQLITETVARLRNMPNVNILPVHVLQHTSVFALPRLKQYCQDIGLPLKCSEVYHQSAWGNITLHSVSPHDIEKFKLYLAENPDPTFQAWIDKYKFDLHKHQRFHQYVDMLDSIRGTNFSATFNPTWQM